MRIRTFFTILGFVTLVGCSSTGASSSAGATSGPSDADVERTIKSRLATDPEVALTHIEVSADAKRNEVVLSGTVPTEEHRTRVVELAKNAEPGLIVTDKIVVMPPEVARGDYTEDMARDARRKATDLGDQLGNSLDDAWIHGKVLAKLTADRGAPALKVNIDVVDQSVTLRGEVESPEAKAEFGRIAKETDGVKRVTNLLRVRQRSNPPAG